MMTARYAIVTDIEGTTSSIAFVKETLFPFAKRRLASYVSQNLGSPEVREALRQTRELAGQLDLSGAAVVDLLKAWIDEDRKATPLKDLQGLIWADGYATGELTGDVYPDAVEGLWRWRAAGLALYVYSSGSIKAQKLLYGHTAFGDLTPLFSGYFDTGSGPKFDARSYAAIAAAIGFAPGRVLFLSDQTAELDAARSAGLGTAALNRGEAVLPEGHGHPEFASFADIDPLGGRLFPLA